MDMEIVERKETQHMEISFRSVKLILTVYSSKLGTASVSSFVLLPSSCFAFPDKSSTYCGHYRAPISNNTILLGMTKKECGTFYIRGSGQYSSDWREANALRLLLPRNSQNLQYHLFYPAFPLSQILYTSPNISSKAQHICQSLVCPSPIKRRLL